MLQSRNKTSFTYALFNYLVENENIISKVPVDLTINEVAIFPIKHVYMGMLAWACDVYFNFSLWFEEDNEFSLVQKANSNVSVLNKQSALGPTETPFTC